MTSSKNKRPSCVATHRLEAESRRLDYVRPQTACGSSTTGSTSGTVGSIRSRSTNTDSRSSVTVGASAASGATFLSSADKVAAVEAVHPALLAAEVTDSQRQKVSA